MSEDDEIPLLFQLQVWIESAKRWIMSSRLPKRQGHARAMRSRNTHTHRISAVALLLTLASWGCIHAEPAVPDETGNTLLTQVISRLPQERLTVSGQLHVRRLGGIPVANLRFTMQLDWGSSPARTVYTISNLDGTPIEQLTLTRYPGGSSETQYSTGNPLVSRDLPPLSEPIQGTDMSWTDLTLDFLWWPRCVPVGEDDIRGRKTFVVDLYPPADSPDSIYSRVRAWIDQKEFILLRAQGYDATDTLTRELWIKSLKKIDERWMIKDLEVQQYPVEHRTKLRVYDAHATGEDATDG